MRRFAIVTVGLLVAGMAFGATLILKGGKKIEAASMVQKGNYVVVQYANGRSESYPLSAVDLDAMNAAAATAKPGPAPTVGPHSPFFGAQAKSGTAGAVFTDADLERIHQPVEETEGQDKEKDKGTAKEPGDKSGRVVLAGYDKKLAESGQWDVTLTVSNAGAKNVLGVIATVQFLGPQGEPIGSGSGSYPGTLEPGKQGTITVRVASEKEPGSVNFDFQWQEERTVVPTASPSPSSETGKKGKGQPAATPTPQQAAGYSRPAGSSPNTLVTNPMGVVSLTQPPVAAPAGAAATTKPK